MTYNPHENNYQTNIYMSRFTYKESHYVVIYNNDTLETQTSNNSGLTVKLTSIHRAN